MENLGISQKWLLVTDSWKKTKNQVTLKFRAGGGVTGVFDLGNIDIYGTWTQENINFSSHFRNTWNEFYQTFEGKWTNVDLIMGETKYKYDDGTEISGTFKMVKIIENRIVESRVGNEKDRHFDFSVFLSDFRIVCSDKTEVGCHKQILISKTEYFKGFFRLQRCDTDKVELDFKSDIVNALVCYLYTADINITLENVLDLLVAANYIDIPGVINRCVQLIQQKIDTSNCIDLFNWAEYYNFKEICEASVNFVANHEDWNSVMSAIGTENSDIPVNYFKSLVSKNLTLRDDHRRVVGDSEKKKELRKLAQNYCHGTSESEEFNSLISLINDLPEKKLYQILKPQIYASVGIRRNRKKFSYCGYGKRFIKSISLKWTFLGRNSVNWKKDKMGKKFPKMEYIRHSIVSGLVIKWSDGSQDEEGGGDTEDLSTEYDVPTGEHLVMVHGDGENISFVLSNGKLLRSSSSYLTKFNSLSTLTRKQNMFNAYIDGIKGTVSRKKEGHEQIENLEFQYGIVIDQEEREELEKNSVHWLISESSIHYA